MELSGKVVVITGAGSGIGRATAHLFAEQGATIVVCGRSLSSLNETVRQIERKNLGNALAISVDVTSWDQVENMISTILQQFGRIDILINNAGIMGIKPIVQVTEKEWEDILDTNLKGVFLCCKAVIPSMVAANQGIIINISSTLGKTGIAYHGAYCASKFGVIGLTESLANELKENKIRVFAVCPGSTNTELHRKAVGEEIARFAMPPRIVAETILRLSLKNSTVLSGSSIIIDESTSHAVADNYKSKLIGGLKSIMHPNKILHKINMSFRK
jgi:NAD(P)-dependent dehydrogenase (short-subunit alcohol dehydrogenase family)